MPSRLVEFSGKIVTSSFAAPLKEDVKQPEEVSVEGPRTVKAKWIIPEFNCGPLIYHSLIAYREDQDLNGTIQVFFNDTSASEGQKKSSNYLHPKSNCNNTGDI